MGKYDTLTNFSMKEFQDENNWQIIYKGGVSYRVSPSYNDKAAGKGPEFGQIVTTLGGPISGDDRVWYLKVQANGMYMYLPMNTKNEPNRPVCRPVDETTATERNWEVVYPGGVAWRVSAMYNDKDDASPQGPVCGDVIKGRPITGTDGFGKKLQFVKVGIGQFLPLTTKDGTPVLERRDDPEPAPAPAPAPAPVRPQPVPVPVPVSYPPAAPAAPLWTEHSSNGRPYWANTQTGETTWKNPNAAPPPPAGPPVVNGWARFESGGRPYWAHEVTRETTWTDPTPYQELSSGGRPYWYDPRNGSTTWVRPF